MIVDYTRVKHIYLVCGKTDMRKATYTSHILYLVIPLIAITMDITRIPR